MDKLRENGARLVPTTRTDDGRLNLLLVSNDDAKGSRQKSSGDLNRMFWSRWLYDCRQNIGKLTIDELRELKKFVENESSEYDVVVHSENGTIANMPDAFSALFKNPPKIPAAPQDHALFSFTVVLLIALAYASLFVR